MLGKQFQLSYSIYIIIILDYTFIHTMGFEELKKITVTL